MSEDQRYGASTAIGIVALAVLYFTLPFWVAAFAFGAVAYNLDKAFKVGE